MAGTLAPGAAVGGDEARASRPRTPRAPAKVVDARRRTITCRLRLELSPGSWLHTFSTRHPDFQVELFDRFPLASRRTLAEVRFHGAREDGWRAELERLPGVEQIELLEEDELSWLCQVSHVTPLWLTAARRLRILWRHPIWIVNGVARWEIVAAEERVRDLLAEMAPLVTTVRVEALARGASRRPTELLTVRQNEILRRAVNEGYFEVPRRISLTELAQRLSVSKSTLSVRLAVVERKLIAGAAGTWGLSGPSSTSGSSSASADFA
jgi:hypothetical protein